MRGRAYKKGLTGPGSNKTDYKTLKEENSATLPLRNLATPSNGDKIQSQSLESPQNKFSNDQTCENEHPSEAGGFCKIKHSKKKPQQHFHKRPSNTHTIYIRILPLAFSSYRLGHWTIFFHTTVKNTERLI